ncbi:hypothetical protein Ct61P_04523 [Colletotrichum tofieldiae]|nr:hypothetical protein Ct61P_04523 [Colletotrichum tofieldiae]
MTGPLKRTGVSHWQRFRDPSISGWVGIWARTRQSLRCEQTWVAGKGWDGTWYWIGLFGTKWISAGMEITNDSPGAIALRHMARESRAAQWAKKAAWLHRGRVLRRGA